MEQSGKTALTFYAGTGLPIALAGQIFHNNLISYPKEAERGNFHVSAGIGFA